MNISIEEKIAISALKRLAKKWPDTLWLFSASGTLCVMKKTEDNDHARLANGAVDPSFCITTISIESDGGDW